MSRRRSGSIRRSASSSASGDRKVPYIIGVAGSVAVGKSTTARVLQALLARWSPRPKVDLVTTDGFLFPNAVLEREGLMQKKGFPESYDLPTLLSFLSDIKAGRRPVRAPVYSHLTYDIVPERMDRGRPARHPDRRRASTCCRPAGCRATARRSRSSPTSSISRSISMPTRRCCANGMSSASWRCATPRSSIRDPTSIAMRSCPTRRRPQTALAIWERTNLANLEDNILPTRPRATLILKKGADHVVETVALRRL